MAEREGPSVYSIAAHRGFADALVAGVVPRYFEAGLGLARLTLLLPSTRAVRTVTEAFIRQFGESGQAGMLMPRMVVAGDLDLDESLGSLLDPLGAQQIPPSVDPIFRWLRLAQLVQQGEKAPPKGAALFKLAQDTARTMDRLLVEEVQPEDLLSEPVKDLFGELAGHWQDTLRRFATVQAKWLVELEAMGKVDAATRRNLLFDHVRKQWADSPPSTPIVAAGVTSAAPALARLLRTIADLPQGAVILPDFDLTLDDAVWRELGQAGYSPEPDGPVFGKGDAVTHPQYHLKLLLNRMGVARAEVQAWHRKGTGAARPERSHAVSAVFLPPEASKVWAGLPPEKRHLAGIRLLEMPNPEAEAQAVALAARHALETPEQRVAIVTPDRGLARRIVHHLRRWNIEADDSAGRPLSQTTAGRLLLLLAEVMAERSAPVSLMALLGHPLVKRGEARADWLRNLRAFEIELRGPRPAAGLEPLRERADEAKVRAWWDAVEAVLAPLSRFDDDTDLVAMLHALATTGEALCGEDLWAQEDGRSLASFIDDLRLNALAVGTIVDPQDLPGILTDAMEAVAVRPPYGGHPRIAIYGLLEARMTRADLVICAGLNEGSWPGKPSVDPLLAPPVLRALGVPGADFRIGLAAHDLAGALGAPNVILSRSERDAEGPALASRFLLRVKALLGELADRYEEKELPAFTRALDTAPRAKRYQPPRPSPTAEQRRRRISVTALDRLRSDPFAYFAGHILRLSDLDALDAEPTPAWQGSLAHTILERWLDEKGDLFAIAAEELGAMDHHPVTRALWEPRLLKALEWVKGEVEAHPERVPKLFEAKATMERKGIAISGQIDRLDRLADGSFAVVDYKTGHPPGGTEVAAGYALQLGTLGLMVRSGAFAGPDFPDGGVEGEPALFEYWSLAKAKTRQNEAGFGYIATPLKIPPKRTGIDPEDFLPQAERFLDEALDTWILGDAPFTAEVKPDATRYGTYDQLMRLAEWYPPEPGEGT